MSDLPKIWVFSVTHNSAPMTRWWLRHYEKFADKILVWDDHSTDGTREILRAHPKVEMKDWPHGNGIDENQFLAFAHEIYPTAAGKAQWVMWADSDEFIMSTQFSWEEIFTSCENCDVIQTLGFNMVGDGTGLPSWKQSGDAQIYDLIRPGVFAPIYSKPVVFRPEVRIRWNRGKHTLEDCTPRLSHKPLLKLLHFRYLGADYTRERNAKNYARLGLEDGDKGAGWTCAPGYDGWEKEGSPTWATRAVKESFDVIRFNI